MAADIQSLANTLIYNGRLRCGSDAISNQVLEVQLADNPARPSWMLEVVKAHTDNWTRAVFTHGHNQQSLPNDHLLYTLEGPLKAPKIMQL